MSRRYICSHRTGPASLSLSAVSPAVVKKQAKNHKKTPSRPFHVHALTCWPSSLSLFLLNEHCLNHYRSLPSRTPSSTAPCPRIVSITVHSRILIFLSSTEEAAVFVSDTGTAAAGPIARCSVKEEAREYGGIRSS